MPRSSAYSTPDATSPGIPERSPLEPLSAYSRRKRKAAVDNARWEGQKRALELLDKKRTPVPMTPDPKVFP